MTDPQLRPLGTYETGVFGESAAEIVAHHPNTQRVFVVNANNATIDVLDISDPSNPDRINQIDVSPFGAGANSVAVNDNGIVAVAVEAEVAQNPGTVAFFDADGDTLNQVTVGALPDMLTFTSDGTKVLVANEGEPNDDYSNDPEGSVSIIDISGGVENLTQTDVSTADFSAFNGREEELRNKGVRIFGPGSNAAKDFEPEYIAVDANDTTAFVTLQENNAVAVVDIENATILDVLPLGVKDYSRGLPSLTTFEFPDFPLGTTEGDQEILLGGLSGLWYEGTDDDGNLQFVTVPDRGPNGAPTDVDNDGDNERPFALPDYQARIVRFTLDEDSGDIEITEQIFLNREDGTTPITGLPNIPGIDEEPVDLSGNLLEYDPLGADMEGIVINDDGTYWTVDEYRPAIYHFDVDGSLIDRFVPEGTAALAGETEGTFGTETLPEEYSNRRRNRGFEAIALDTDEDILYSFIQTPLANPDRSASDDSSVIRMLGIDPETGEPVAEYVYLLEKPTIDPDNGSLLVDKIGDAVYDADNDTFYILERDSSTTATGKKFIFEIDLTGATNLLADDAPNLPDGTTLEQLTADELAALDIQPVNKTKITNLPSLGYLAGDKPEGLSLLPDGRLAVLNDNDFGLRDDQILGDGTVPLNPDPVPVVLGVIDFSESNQLDPSDEDGGINLDNWPVFGLFQPDSIASFEINDETFYATANEGDSRDYDGFSEEVRVGDEEYVLDENFDVAAIEDEAALGRLQVTNTEGDLDGDGDFDQIFAYGGRSFSIWDAAGNLVFDSGDAFEQITAEERPEAFNSNGDEDSFDTRSDAKGPEPEAITTGVLDGKTYAFIGLERIGGIMVYDVSEPTTPTFEQYINNPGDIGPEGLKFISPEDSPNGDALLVVANEVSGTTTVYEFTPDQDIPGNSGDNNLEGGTGDDNIDGLAGNDTISGLGGSDTISGSAGNDDINGNRGDDRVSGGDGDDRVNGGFESDIIFGNNGDDTLIGRLGNDRMLGGPGEDILSGGIGRDRINGGADDDILTGGASIDRFIFAANSEFSEASLGIDEITDFNPDLDLILLDLTTFTEITTTSGEDIGDEFAIVESNGDAASSEAIVVYNSSNGGLFYNANGSDGGFGDGGRFATLTGTPTISAEDFVIR